MLAAALSVSLLATASAPNGLDDATLRARSVLTRFYAAATTCKVSPPPLPNLTSGSTRGVIHYDGQGTIVIYPWDVMDEGTHRALESLAASSADPRSGREAYQSIFNELLVAHEAAHWLQAGRLSQDRWASEYNANQIMVAFWREHPAGLPTNTRLAEYLRFVPGDHNPDPPPAGQSTPEYFNANYMRLMRGPAYGWYQNISGRQATDERPQPKFCDLVRRWTKSEKASMGR